MVEYCHSYLTNGNIEAFCVTAQVAFQILAVNEYDFCGPCVG
jgi:hypothetical protein